MQQRPVYVLDDDKAVLDSTAFMLDCYGYRGELFDDPERFLQQVNSLPAGCVLTDLRMPKVTGFDLIVAIRKLAISWPIFLMTSENGPEMERRAKARGFAGYLRKPVQASTLIGALERGFAALDGSIAD